MVEELGKAPLIEPMKRESFPEEVIEEYRRDEVLWNESQMVKDEYVAEFFEGMISHLQVFLSISLTHHYEIFIDFSDYPSKPKITIGEGLQKELGRSLEDLLFYYRNWDKKIPPHIMEIIREFEAVLMKYKANRMLSDTDEMPEAALPELEPLPELPPLEQEQIPIPKKEEKLEESVEEKEKKDAPSEKK